MKKLFVSFVTAALLLIMIPSQAKEAARDIASTSVAMKKTESDEVAALISRVNEINAMDKSSLNATEKSALRSELREVKREVNRRRNETVYISGGLIILIIVLIIVL